MPDSVTDIEFGSFQNCHQLNDVKLSSSIESIGDFAFDGCESLKEIKLPEKITKMHVNSFPVGCNQKCDKTLNIKLTSESFNFYKPKAITITTNFNNQYERVAIIDYGSYSIKTGFAFNLNPIQFSENKRNDGYINIGPKSFSYPIEKGIVTNWDEFEEMT